MSESEDLGENCDEKVRDHSNNRKNIMDCLTFADKMRVPN